MMDNPSTTPSEPNMTPHLVSVTPFEELQNNATLPPVASNTEGQEI